MIRIITIKNMKINESHVSFIVKNIILKWEIKSYNWLESAVSRFMAAKEKRKSFAQETQFYLALNSMRNLNNFLYIKNI